MSQLITFTLQLILVFFLISCSVQPVTVPEHKILFPKPDPSAALISDEKISKYWWYARFKFIWTETNNSVKFSDDLFIAHQIIIPVLDEHHEAVDLWRFHRRAANDDAGHQFSFIFYASQKTAAAIFQKIENNPLLEQLFDDKIIERVRLDDVTKPKREKIEDTSDKNWSLAIQKSWPYYIMGVSTLWLDLVNQEISKSKLDTSETIQLQRVEYNNIHEQISRQWREQGKHAFFHHINAIFGYEPLNVRY